MKTALYRVVKGGGFICTIRVDGRVVDTLQHANVGTLMRQKARLHPDATTVTSVFDTGAGAAPRALEEAFA